MLSCTISGLIHFPPSMGCSVASVEKEFVMDLVSDLFFLRWDDGVMGLGFLFSTLFGTSMVDELAGLDEELDSWFSRD